MPWNHKKRRRSDSNTCNCISNRIWKFATFCCAVVVVVAYNVAYQTKINCRKKYFKPTTYLWLFVILIISLRWQLLPVALCTYMQHTHTHTSMRACVYAMQLSIFMRFYSFIVFPATLYTLYVVGNVRALTIIHATMLNWINFVVLCGTSTPQRTAAHFNEFILLNFISQFFHCIYILFMQFQRVAAAVVVVVVRNSHFVILLLTLISINVRSTAKVSA